MSLIIAGVCERDIDLLLMEELVSSAEFRGLIATAAGVGDANPDISPIVKRSVTHSSGESDLELRIGLTDGRRAVVLIEDKVDAALQTSQALRYSTRAKALVDAGSADVVRTLIIAPRRYFGTDGNTKDFDAALSYEDIDLWFGQQSTMGDRAMYKRSLIAAAIEKAILGYQPQTDEPMTTFWRTYHGWVQRIAPELNMAEPRGRPEGSTFIFFQPDRFPTSLRLVHKFAHGHVDLEFTGCGNRLSEVRTAIQSVIPAGCTLVKISKAAAIRRAVPRLDPLASESQEALAAEGINASREVLEWYRKHEPMINRLLT